VPSCLPRPAFTLVELVISIGLLGLMMILAGKVFSLSVESTSQAEALMDVSQSLRLLEDSLRQDLAGIDPDRSLMVIASLPVSAYWTPEDAQGDEDANDPTAGPLNGYPHVADPEREVVTLGINGNAPPPVGPARLENPRADVLMFFTTRQATSKRFPQIRSNAVQVVYGHAELGELGADGRWSVAPDLFAQFEATLTQPFWNNTRPYRDRYIARNWHLARREVLLVDSAKADVEAAFNNSFTIGVPAALTSDFVWKNDLIETAKNPIGMLALSDGELDLVTLQDGFNYDTQVLNANATPTQWYHRSRIDLTPPFAWQYRMGHYFLPNCAAFKVEWALSHPNLKGAKTVIWVDPANVANTVVADLQNLISMGYVGLANLQSEFQGTPSARFDPGVFGSTHEFFAHNPGPIPGVAYPVSSATDPDPFFPKALRITVDVYDGGGRFVRPMRHVMVIPVGSQAM